MQKLLIGGVLSLLITMIPLRVMAQAAPFDDETRATVIALAQQVGHAIAPGMVSAPLLSEVDAPDASPGPEVEGPASEPIDGPIELPELDLTDLAEYTSQGVTIQVPADWFVDTDMGEDSPFTIEVPGTDLEIAMEADANLDFPSWLGVALFRTQADVLIGELEGGKLVEVRTIHTSQNLPMAKVGFTGIENDEPLSGALYVIAPNNAAYIIFAGGTTEEWEYALPGIELMAQSVIFDEDLIDVVLAGDEPLSYANADGSVELTVPAGWYAMDTGDSQFPVILAEPEVLYVAAIGTEESFGTEIDPDMLQAFVPEEGELDPELHDVLIEELMALVSSSGSPMILDEELSEVTSREGAVTVRLVGDADLGGGLAIPVALYFELRFTNVAVVAIFGDVESALLAPDVIRGLIESVNGLQ